MYKKVRKREVRIYDIRKKTAQNQDTAQKFCWKRETQISDVPTYMKKCEEITNLTVLIINNNFD